MSDVSEEHENLQQKHRTEKKELRATIQQLKKSVNNCKKKKKEVAEQITKLENDLKEKHEREMQELATHSCNTGDAPVENSDEKEDCQRAPEKSSPKMSRAAKKRAKKAAEEREREAELKKEKEELLFTSPRALELKKMTALLKERGLKVHDIPADGDCLFNAVSHQLGGDRSQSQLRHSAVEHIRRRKEDFLPFLTSQHTGDALSCEEFEQYCADMADTHVWGGQLEIQALSIVLQRKIEVLQAEGAPISVGEELPGAPLLLAFYRHAFRSGEHYNSVLPL